MAGTPARYAATQRHPATPPSGPRLDNEPQRDVLFTLAHFRQVQPLILANAQIFFIVRQYMLLEYCIVLHM